MSHLLARFRVPKATRSIPSRGKRSLAIVFAMSFTLLTAISGFTLDHLAAANTSTSLEAIADAATLAGVSSASVASTAASGQQEKRLEDMMRQDFEAQVANQPALKEAVRTANFSVVISGETITAATCYRAEHPTLSSRFLGQKPIAIMNCASATSSPQVIDQNTDVLLDTSGSMGLDASPKDLASVTASPGESDFMIERINKSAAGQRQVRLSR